MTNTKDMQSIFKKIEEEVRKNKSPMYSKMEYFSAVSMLAREIVSEEKDEHVNKGSLSVSATKLTYDAFDRYNTEEHGDLYEFSLYFIKNAIAFGKRPYVERKQNLMEEAISNMHPFLQEIVRVLTNEDGKERTAEDIEVQLGISHCSLSNLAIEMAKETYFFYLSMEK